MIRHTAVFRLKHAAGSAAERDFLAANRALKSIPGVEAFELLRQVSPKNDFTFGVSMEFADDAAYRATTITRPMWPLCATAGCRRWRPSWKSITSHCRNSRVSATSP